MHFNKLKLAVVFCTLATTLVFFGGCKKNELNLNKNAVDADGGFFKLGWFSPALSTQGVQLKIDGARVSNLLGLGYTSTTNYAMPYPGGGLNTGGNNKSDYLNVTAGSHEVIISIPQRNTNNDSVMILKTAIDVAKGAFKTLIVTDSFPNAQAYLLNDTTVLADSGFVRINFTNAIPNVGGGLDFLVTNSAGTNTVLASNVMYKSATFFLNVPYVTGTYTFAIRKNGTTTNLATYATSSLTNKRVYTLVGRGYLSATGTRAPAISLIYNR